jgi:hypothetical protein
MSFGTEKKLIEPTYAQEQALKKVALVATDLEIAVGLAKERAALLSI